MPRSTCRTTAPWKEEPLTVAVSRVMERIGDLRVGAIANFVLPLLVASLPVLQGFHVIESLWWLGIWLVVYIADSAHSRFRRGAAARATTERVSDALCTFAGDIDVASQALIRAPDRAYGEEESKRICIGLLARAKVLTALALNVDGGLRLRATLAVPVIIGGRAVLSVLCIPVHAGGPSGRCLAVMSIDASRRNYFEERAVKRAVVPLVQAIVNELALIILLRRQGERYEFQT